MAPAAGTAQDVPVAELLLGPVLRRVVHDDQGTVAGIWVQTDQRAQITVRAAGHAATADTFSAYGVHLGFVQIEGLPPGDHPYEVLVDGVAGWPLPDLPASTIRIPHRTATDATIVFGSCREATAHTHSPEGYDADALEVLAERLSAGGERPDLLALIGDQIYADNLSTSTKRWLAGLDRGADHPTDQVTAFPEYAYLYRESWSVPLVRWLLSTVPTVMIFDDHEIVDDWNSSGTWLADASRQPWWQPRIVAGISSYWLFQHLGNVHPRELAADPVWQGIRQSPADATAVLEAFARRHAEPAGPDPYQWGYHLDIGRTRLIMIDCRGNRVLSGPKRRMMPQAHWDAVAAQSRADCDHLVLACSLPWLLAPAVHHGEAVMEVLADRLPVMERLRRDHDLEHWAAVGHSFDELTDLIAGVTVPATVSVLGGDVHHSYVARARLRGRSGGPAVHQVTCSPLHQNIQGVMRTLLRAGWWRLLSGPASLVARLAGVPRPAVRWRAVTKVHFGNAVGTLTHRGRSATASLETVTPAGTLEPAETVPLSRG
jgi:hypothetical protein